MADPHKNPVTMHDVAHRAGVALSSVSRVLSGHPDVSRTMRTRVTEAAEELGYEPDFLAQSLRRGSTMTVGFAIRDISNPLFGSIAKAAEQTLRRRGYSILMTNSGSDLELEREHLIQFRRRRVDGLILSLTSEQSTPALEMLSDLDRPIVLIDRDAPIARSGVVLCDHHAGSLAAVSDLLAAGHTRTAFVAGEPHLRATRERLRGYVEAHARANIPIDESLIFHGTYTEEHGRHATAMALEAPEPATAIFAGGIQLATGAISVLTERRVLIGNHHFGFVACDALPVMRMLAPGIGSVTRDASRIGEEAASDLLRQLDGQPPDATVVPTVYVAGS